MPGSDGMSTSFYKQEIYSVKEVSQAETFQITGSVPTLTENQLIELWYNLEGSVYVFSPLLFSFLVREFRPKRCKYIVCYLNIY